MIIIQISILFLITWQCCLISGESGAGKTVSADYLVRHLAELGKVGTHCCYSMIVTSTIVNLILIKTVPKCSVSKETIVNDSWFLFIIMISMTNNFFLSGWKQNTWREDPSGEKYMLFYTIGRNPISSNWSASLFTSLVSCMVYWHFKENLHVYPLMQLKG